MPGYVMLPSGRSHSVRTIRSARNGNVETAHNIETEGLPDERDGSFMSAPTFPFLDGNKRLLVDALGRRLAPGVADYLDLFTDDAVLEIPYGVTAEGDRVEGRAAIAAYMEQLRGHVTLEAMALRALHQATDGTLVLEYDGTVQAEAAGVRFHQRYVAVVALRDGRIAAFREYSNPLLAREAFAGRSDGGTAS